MTVKRMDSVLIVVDDLEAVKAFFIELGLELEDQTTVEGASFGNLIGLEDVQATLAMLRTPDGQGIELDKFHTPNAVRFGPVDTPVNALGLRRLMFAIDDIDAVVAWMQAQAKELNSLGKCSTRNCTGSPIFVGLRASSSGLPSNSAKVGEDTALAISGAANSLIQNKMGSPPAYSQGTSAQ